MPLTKREGSENHGRQAGRYYGKIDGKLNAATMAAVRSFQQAKGLPTGHLTIETLQVLGVRTGGWFVARDGFAEIGRLPKVFQR